jgi:hypothetical protein
MFDASDPERWIALAKIARAQAECMQNEAARQEMLDLANLYDRLLREAERLAARAKGNGMASE